MDSERLTAIDWRRTPFRELELIGSGAMGSVARGRDERNGRAVALKLLTDSEPTKRERFLREAQLAARVVHPNVVGIHEVYPLEQGGHVMVAELVDDARHLDEAWRTASARARVEMLRDAARGVAAAHAVGVTHRDLKPANVLVDGGGRVRVADFGVAFAADLDRLTQTGAMVGTPSFMAPEQFGVGTPGPYSDVWALGVMLYLALTDELPFGAPSLGEIATSIQSGIGRRHRAALQGAPRALVRVIERSLRQAPEQRLPDAAAFADALDDWLADPGERSPSPSRLVFAAGLLGLGGLLATLWAGGRADPPPAAPEPTTSATSASAPDTARARSLDEALQALERGKVTMGLRLLERLEPAPAELDRARELLVRRALGALGASEEAAFREPCVGLARLAAALPRESRGERESAIAHALARRVCDEQSLTNRSYERLHLARKTGARLRDRKLGLELVETFYQRITLGRSALANQGEWFLLLLQLDAPSGFLGNAEVKTALGPGGPPISRGFWREYLSLRSEPESSNRWVERFRDLVLSEAGRRILGPVQWADALARAACLLKPRAALPLLRQAVERDPSSMVGWTELTHVHAKLRDREATVRAAERSAAILRDSGYLGFRTTRHVYGRRLHDLARDLARVGAWDLAQKHVDEGVAYPSKNRAHVLQKYPRLKR